MSGWVKLHEDVNTDARFLSIPLEAQAIFLRLLPLLRGTGGALELVPGLDAAGTVHATFKGVESRSQAESIVAAWVRVRLVDLTDGALVVRAFASRQGVSTLGISGPGSRQGKSSTERSREYRRKQREAATGGATDCNGNVQRDATGDATDTATGDATGCNAATVAGNGNATDSESLKTPEAKAFSADATVLRRTAAALEKRREEEKRAEESMRESPADSPGGSPGSLSGSPDSHTHQPHESGELELAPPARTVPPGRSKPTRARRAKGQPEPALDLVPPAGSLAARVLSAIVGDRILGPIVAGPGDFATRVCADGAFPRVDVLAEIRQAGIYAARYPGKYRDGNAFLSGWLKRSAEREALKPRAAPSQLEAARQFGPEDEAEFERLLFEGTNRVQEAG